MHSLRDIQWGLDIIDQLLVVLAVWWSLIFDRTCFRKCKLNLEKVSLLWKATRKDQRLSNVFAFKDNPFLHEVSCHITYLIFIPCISINCNLESLHDMCDIVLFFYQTGARVFNPGSWPWIKAWYLTQAAILSSGVSIFRYTSRTLLIKNSLF